MTNETPNPPVDTPGEWVYTDEFEGRKSFGWFNCGRCGKCWISAHAQPKYKQACKSCNAYSRPILMWQNSEKGKQDKRDKRNESTKPHDRGRCEACKKGDCVDSLGAAFGRMDWDD
jgi:hypothetical protein